MVSNTAEVVSPLMQRWEWVDNNCVVWIDDSHSYFSTLHLNLFQELRVDPHKEMLARLDWELQQRKR